MSRYKVLPIPSQFTDDFIEFFEYDPSEKLEETEPLFNRTGLYLDREKNVCWVETPHGCWIIGGKEEFQSELEYQACDQFILHDDVIKAFKALESHNLLTKDLRKIWWRHKYAVSLRYTYRESKKWRLEILGK